MKLASFEINNYKSFDVVSQTPLSSGFNVIAGPNNAGKTALLDALTMRFNWNAHRSSKALPRPTTIPNPVSEVLVSVVATGQELLESMLGLSSDIYIPQPVGLQDSPKGGEDFLAYLAQLSEVRIEIAYKATNGKGNQFVHRTFPAVNFYEELGGLRKNRCYLIRVAADRSRLTCPAVVNVSDQRDIFLALGQQFLAQIYSFRAERLNISECAFGSNATLAPDASNLPEVLHLLQTTKPALFTRFVSLVKEVFPAIEYLSVRPKVGVQNVQEVVVWTEPNSGERGDLAFTLKESGTGLGQVLAILYVVLNAQQSQCILIDEPNSFLHPAASRKLIQILAEFREHQYVLSTHSPEVIATARPTNIILLHRDAEKSTVSLLDGTQIESQEKYMQAVGVRLSDVYGSDNIIWVEGPTEEALFPALISQQDLTHPHDVTAILAVKNTGDFHGRKSRRLRLILDLYRRLSTSGALIPPALGFIFDSENLTDEEKRSLIAESRNMIYFLPRRMIENYMLVPAAIVQVFNTLDTFKESQITEDEVREWFVSNGAKQKFFAPQFVVSEVSEVFGERWRINVNGAALLDSFLAERSEQAERYDKLRHGLLLGRALLDAAHSEFDEIRSLLRSVVAKSKI